MQHRVEAEFAALLDEVVARDFPFLGACYGVGTVGAYLGATIDRMLLRADQRRAGDAHRGRRSRSAAGRGCRRPSTRSSATRRRSRSSRRTAVLLASSPGCPVQMFRVGGNVYATQFHPELDVDGITTRIHAYADHGYFAADELELTLAAVRRAAVSHPSLILRNFVERYAR